MGAKRPLAEPATAYPALEENQYKAELELSDRYQGFTAELLRLSLLGIAVFGFLLKQVLMPFDPDLHPNVSIVEVKVLASASILLFGVCALLAVVFRYFSAESTRLYIEGLRFNNTGNADDAKLKLEERRWRVVVCYFAKMLSAASLAAGAVLVALVFIELLA